MIHFVCAGITYAFDLPQLTIMRIETDLVVIWHCELPFPLSLQTESLCCRNAVPTLSGSPIHERLQ